MGEQLNLAHKVVYLVDQANRKISVNLLRYSVDKQDVSQAQVRLFARKTNEEKFQQSVNVLYELQDVFRLFVAMNSVFENVNTNQSICNVLQKVISIFFSSSLNFLFELG